jgi:hypothetical protein
LQSAAAIRCLLSNPRLRNKRNLRPLHLCG